MLMRWCHLALVFLFFVAIFASSDRIAMADASSTERITESFSGKGGRGPYILSWRGITADGERVSLNGSRVFRTTDYLIDYASGWFSFNEAISSADLIVIDYEKGSATSNATSGMASSVSLLNDKSSQLQANYFFDSPKNGSNGMQAQIAGLGLGGSTSGENWKLNSSLLMANQAGDFNQRAGYQFGGEYGIGALKFTGSFARAGENFNLNNSAGLQAAHQSNSLGMTFKPDNRFQYSTSYQSDQGVGSNGDKSLGLKNELTLKPASATTIVASDDRQSSTTGTTAQTVQTDSLRLDQKLSPSLSATAQLQSVKDGDAKTNSNSLAVTTQIAPAASVATTVYQKTTDASGDASAQKETGAQAQVKTTAGSLQVQTDLSASRSDSQRQTGAGLNVATKDGMLNLQTSLNQTNGSDSTQNQKSATIALKPVKPVTISAGYSDQITAPTGTSSSATASATDQRNLGVDYKPTDAFSVSAKIQASDALSQSSRSQALTASVKPVTMLQLDGTVKRRTATGDAASTGNADTYVAQANLTPCKGIKLFGKYAENPESNDAVQTVVQRQIGAETALGALLLNGGYTTEDQLTLASAGSRTTEFGIGYKFAKTTQLKLTYKTVDGFGIGYSDQRDYGFNFNRDLGDKLTLSLIGEANKQVVSGSEYGQTYSGSVNLGVKF